MSLRDEFRTQVSLLEHVDWQRITSRLAELLRWMRNKSEFVAILDDLKNNGPVYQRLNLGPHPQARADVARTAGTERDIATVGLAMMELCTVPHGRDHFHQIAVSFGIQPPLNMAVPHNHLCDAAMNQFVKPFLNYVFRQLPPNGQPNMIADSQPSKIAAAESLATKNPQTVFVIHGRNEAARKSMFEFLRAIGLKPLEWSQALAATGEASPYIGQVLDTAFTAAQAVVVLMTPDDEACLKNEFCSEHDEKYERQATGQARPNVLFEAGMAMGRNPKRTVLVQVGELRPFSDIAGRHILRLNNSSEQRQNLAERLRTAGCAVDLSGTDWHKVGSFVVAPTSAGHSPLTKPSSDI